MKKLLFLFTFVFLAAPVALSAAEERLLDLCKVVLSTATVRFQQKDEPILRVKITCNGRQIVGYDWMSRPHVWENPAVEQCVHYNRLTRKYACYKESNLSARVHDVWVGRCAMSNKIIRMHKGDEKVCFSIDSYAECVRVSTDGRFAVAGLGNGRIKVFDVEKLFAIDDGSDESSDSS